MSGKALAVVRPKVVIAQGRPARGEGGTVEARHPARAGARADRAGARAALSLGAQAACAARAGSTGPFERAAE